MAATTGLEPWSGVTGTDYASELVRQATRVLAEITSEAVAAPTTPRPVTVLRRQVQVAGNRARGISATWTTVAGLGDLFGVVFGPGEWGDFQASPNATRLLEGERVILIADVPAAGGVGADKILTTDRIQYDDAIYGEHAFEITEMSVDQNAGVVRARVRYAREEGV